MASVSMGQMAVARSGDEDLFALGLGSCIGLVVLDRVAGIAGLAHIVLPASHDGDRTIGKFADLAVPELIAELRRAGALPRRLEAVLVGGARMFATGELDIGARNAAAVQAALAELDVSVKATAIGGDRGRTVRICPKTGTVTVKEAGGEPMTVLGDPSVPEPYLFFPAETLQSNR